MAKITWKKGGSGMIIRYSLSAMLVSPDAIHQHVKTKIEETKRMHYTAPEYAGQQAVVTP